MTPVLATRRFGDPSRPAVVLLHSIATSSAMWQPQIAALSASFDVIALDLPGHGASVPLAASAALGDFAESVLHTLERLEVKQAAFVGLSFGGMIVQRIAATAAGHVSALVLSNGVAFTPDPARQAWAERIAAAGQGGMATQVAPTLERWFTPAFRAASPDVVAGIGTLVGATPVAAYAAAAEAIRALDHRDLLPIILAPTLVLAGEHDTAAPVRAVRAIAEAIPGATFATLPAAHLMNIELRDRYTAILTDFLVRHASTKRA
jgi:3-oxoadipate enol-lactonase